MALKGIEQAMVIIHGSQGCSTYIRRHMATHYNEPIDIASSSLSEQGTVYGGAENLKKGIKNMVKMYEPSLIGILTTCLAETIGEDIERIAEELKIDEPSLSARLIPIPTPGYGGTQYEGYYRALRCIVEKLASNSEPNKVVNIIAPNVNPGDIRYLKEILKDFGIQYIMFPDISNTLDGPFKKVYNHLPEGGTSIREIEKMAGALATIEIGIAIEDNMSPGNYLKEVFGVPLYRCSMPLGLEGNDEFMALLELISGRKQSQKYIEERGRYLDALIDAHKYNGEGRAVVYGEPEHCIALTRLCYESGITPVLIAMGTSNSRAKEILESYSNKYSNKYSKVPLILEDTDFETIEKYALELKANIMLGNSDGRRIEEKQEIKLIRIGFPVHDRLGGQRKVILGYHGSTNLIEETANSILSAKESGYREDMYTKYYDKSFEAPQEKALSPSINTEMSLDVKEKTSTHPCFNAGAHNYARMHIAVAPKCNISCNYCSRKFDCVNESRPGVTSEVLTAEKALEKFIEVKKKIPNLSVVGIAGPGDALANFEETKKSIELIKRESPHITFCLSTNGLMLPFYAEELISLGVSHVTVTINAVDPAIGEKLYSNINYLGKNLQGREGAEVLLRNQIIGLQYLAHKNITCKVNIVMVKGINDEHIPEVVKKVKEYGVYITNIMQLIPAPGSKFENMPLVSHKELHAMRKKCEVDVKQMYHCRQCRADAIGRLSEDRSLEFRCCSSKNIEEKEAGVFSEAAAIHKGEVKVEPPHYRIAVSSKSGLNIDEHFGHAKEFYIYEINSGEITFLEKRDVIKYCEGPGGCDDTESKFYSILTIIKDCHAVLTMRAGTEPVRKLEREGIKVIQMYESILKGIEKAAKILQENPIYKK